MLLSEMSFETVISIWSHVRLSKNEEKKMLELQNYLKFYKSFNFGGDPV